MTARWRALVVAGLVLSIVAGVAMPAAEAETQDPKDSGGAEADIASISSFRSGSSIVHELSTYGSWSDRDVADKGLDIGFHFFLHADSSEDRTLTVTFDGSTLHATLTSKSGRAREVPLARPDDRSLRVTIPIRLLAGPHVYTYRWYATVDQAYAVQLCPTPTPAAASPSPTESPQATASPSPSPSDCPHGDVFRHDRAPDHGKLTQVARHVPSRFYEPPPTLLIARGKVVDKPTPYTWSTCYPVDGATTCVIADGIATWSTGPTLKAGQTARIRFRRRDKPKSVSLSGYPRLGDVYPEGRKHEIRLSLRPVRNHRRRVAWDAIFRPRRIGHYYCFLAAQWGAGPRHPSQASVNYTLHFRTRARGDRAHT